MNGKRFYRPILGVAVALMLLGSLTAFGEGIKETETRPEYPTRPITIVCPWKVGGAAEIGARIFGKHLSDVLGVRVDVVSKTGGTGATGTVFVKNSPADGYSLLQTYIGPFAQVPLYLGEESQYDPLQDFEAIGQVGIEPVVFLVKKDTPWSTMNDFIADAKRNPGKYKCGAGGQLSLHALFAGILFDRVGADVAVVAYPGALMGIPDLLGGDLHIIAGNPTGIELYPQLKGIATLMDEPWPTIPDVPTLKSQGIDLDTVPTWWGFSVRAGTPEHIQRILVEATEKVASSQAFRDEMLEKIKVEVFYAGPDEFYQLWQDSLEAMKPAVDWLLKKQREQ